MSPDVIMAVVIFAVSAVAAVAVYVAARTILSRSKLSAEVRRSISLVVDGPVVAGILSYGLLAAVEHLESSSPGLLPSIAAPTDLSLILQVVVLAVAVRVTGSVVRILTGPVEHMREAARVIVYGVYALGLVGLAYIALASPISPALATNVWAVINFLTGLLVTYLVVSTVNIIVKKYSQAIEGREKRLQTALTFVRRLTVAVIAVIGISVTTFSSFPAAGTAIASLFIAAGFGSIVIGLAAQSSLSNIFAGMVLAFSQPFKIGDAVLFKNEWCWVEDMRLNFTVLKTWDNRRLVIPNQMFLNDSLINYDLNGSSKLCIVFIQVPYEADLDRAIEIMKAEARRHPDFLPAGNLPVVHVMEYNESGISLRLLSNARDQPTNFQMSKDLLYTIRKEFQKGGIEISYPRRELVLSGELSERFRGNIPLREDHPPGAGEGKSA